MLEKCEVCGKKKKTRKMEGLSHIGGDWRHTTTKCNVGYWKRKKRILVEENQWKSD